MSSRDPSQEDYDYKPKARNNGKNLIQHHGEDGFKKKDSKLPNIFLPYSALALMSIILNIYLLFQYENAKKSVAEIDKLQIEVRSLKKKLAFIEPAIPNEKPINSIMCLSEPDQVLEKILGLTIYSGDPIQPCKQD